jgi:hypothetical protein
MVVMEATTTYMVAMEAMAAMETMRMNGSLRLRYPDQALYRQLDVGFHIVRMSHPKP